MLFQRKNILYVKLKNLLPLTKKKNLLHIKEFVKEFVTY